LRQLVKNPDAGRTFLNINGGYTNRRQYFELRNLNTSFGYEWKKRNSVYTLNLANFELVDLIPSDTFQKIIQNNPVLSYSFNQGVVLGTSATYQHTFFYTNHTNQSSYLRITAEESGLQTGTLLFKNSILRFWKLDGEFRHNITHSKHKWAFRLIGGYGRDYSSGTKTMPFFRQFIAGGPNSMRAWRLRQLGLGNSLAQDTIKGNFKDRLGDVYLETNAEYRFAMFRLFTFPLEGAVFTDVGNIWNRKSRSNLPQDGVFQLKHLYRDIAMDVGYGLRWDFGYLRIRLDAAYKVKDPVREGTGWLQRLEWRSYDRAGTVRNTNVGFQFGIDYPF
jgi:outer membrane protein insertion porin family